MYTFVYVEMYVRRDAAAAYFVEALSEIVGGHLARLRAHGVPRFVFPRFGFFPLFLFEALSLWMFGGHLA